MVYFCYFFTACLRNTFIRRTLGRPPRLLGAVCVMSPLLRFFVVMGNRLFNHRVLIYFSLNMIRSTSSLCHLQGPNSWQRRLMLKCSVPLGTSQDSARNTPTRTQDLPQSFPSSAVQDFYDSTPSCGVPPVALDDREEPLLPLTSETTCVSQLFC